MKRCPNCGREIEEGHPFCGSCGAKLPVTKGKSKKKKSGGAGGLIIAIVVVLVLILGVVGVLVYSILNGDKTSDKKEDSKVSAEEKEQKDDEEPEEEEEKPASEALQALYDTVTVSGITIGEDENGGIIATCTVTTPDIENGFEEAFESIDYDEDDPDASDDALYLALAGLETTTAEYSVDLRPLITEDRDYSEEEVAKMIAEQYVDETLELIAWRTIYANQPSDAILGEGAAE